MDPIDNTTLKVEAFAPIENRRGRYKLEGNPTNLGPEAIHFISAHKLLSGISDSDTFILAVCNA